MTTFFSTTKKLNTLRSLVIIASFGLLFASCSEKHLCPAYPYKVKMKNVENVAYADPSVIQAKG